MSEEKRAIFSGKIGYVLATAGSAMGLGNIWRFPYFAVKYGGGVFLLSYIVLVVTCGCMLMMSETALGRLTRKSPVGAFSTYSKKPFIRSGGWINGVVPMIIISYYCVIGGWVLKYLFEYIAGNQSEVVENSYFFRFLGNSGSVEIWFVIYALINLVIVLLGVNKGIERVSKIMMPSLLILGVVIAVYVCSQPGASDGIKYFLLPDFSHFSIKTLVAALGQMFYSLSIAMGVLCTYGSYMKRDVDIEKSTFVVAGFDTLAAILGGFMIIPAVFAFSGGTIETLEQGPSLTFVMLPRVFDSMPAGRLIAILFFAMFFFAALTSSISLFEVSTSVFEDEAKLSRRKSALIVTAIILSLGSLSSLSYGVLKNIKLFKMQFLDFFDFLSNSILLPISAIFLVLLIVKYVGKDRIKSEIEYSSKFKSKPLYNTVLNFLAPIIIILILLTSILDVIGVIKI